MMEKQTVMNVTEPYDNVTDSKGSDEKVFSPAVVDESTPKEEVEEVTENVEDSDHQKNL